LVLFADGNVLRFGRAITDQAMRKRTNRLDAVPFYSPTAPSPPAREDATQRRFHGFWEQVVRGDSAAARRVDLAVAHLDRRPRSLSRGARPVLLPARFANGFRRPRKRRPLATNGEGPQRMHPVRFDAPNDIAFGALQRDLPRPVDRFRRCYWRIHAQPGNKTQNETASPHREHEPVRKLTQEQPLWQRLSRAEKLTPDLQSCQTDALPKAPRFAAALGEGAGRLQQHRGAATLWRRAAPALLSGRVGIEAEQGST
jgi:hypothetical protein